MEHNPVHGSVLCNDPLIIFISNFNNDMRDVGRLLKSRKVIFIILVNWSITAKDLTLIKDVKSYEMKYPLHECIVFTNTNSEKEILNKFKIEAFVGNHNSLVDPSLFSIQNTGSKDFGVIYNAGLLWWKRHYLCSEIKNISLIYYQVDEGPSLEHIRETLPTARFLNEEMTGTPFGWMGPELVCACLNRAEVGLCLSEVEGAMFASIEYLLAGIPVVSTPSIGGRDLFFDSDYVEIVDPTPLAVAEGVAKVKRRAPPAEEIRARTIARQQERITAFITFLDNLVRRHGGSGYTRENWDAHYSDKLLTCFASASAFVDTLPPERSRPSGLFLERLKRRATRSWNGTFRNFQ